MLLLYKDILDNDGGDRKKNGRRKKERMMDSQFLQVRQVLEYICRQVCDVVHAEVTAG